MQLREGRFAQRGSRRRRIKLALPPRCLRRSKPFRSSRATRELFLPACFPPARFFIPRRNLASLQSRLSRQSSWKCSSGQIMVQKKRDTCFFRMKGEPHPNCRSLAIIKTAKQQQQQEEAKPGRGWRRRLCHVFRIQHEPGGGCGSCSSASSIPISQGGSPSKLLLSKHACVRIDYKG